MRALSLVPMASEVFPKRLQQLATVRACETSMLAGRYNSDIKVWDNFIGIANVNGDNSNLDKRCLLLWKCYGANFPTA